MSFDELFYAISHITDYHGFEHTETFEWMWRFVNNNIEVDIHFNKKIKLGKFETTPGTFLKMQIRFKAKTQNDFIRYNLTLIGIESLLVSLKERTENAKCVAKYGYCSCGEEFVIRYNKVTQQQFLGCSNYPECRNTKPYIQ
ncbi:MAG: topoisomerase DNA-binding C4 zinc finger domain-containing protein [Chitinophagales bacterium]